MVIRERLNDISDTFEQAYRNIANSEEAIYGESNTGYQHSQYNKI